MSRNLRILHLEDDPADVELVEATLVAGGIDCSMVVVATHEEFVAALEEGGFDLVLADFALPAFDGMSALAIVHAMHPELPFIFVSGRLGEETAIESLKNGATDYILKDRLPRLVPSINRVLIEAEERAELKRAEKALRESEMRRYQMQVELVYAAEVQAKLLPRSYPDIPDFDVAARCLPAKQVGGDFFDWQEVCSGVWSFTLGDVMGKGIAAAMLMATVRAALRSVAHNRPQEAIRLAEVALVSDLEISESFVTLVLAQLYAAERRLTFVDCGHGYAFLRRRSGAIESLLPRDLPLGVPGAKVFREGTVYLAEGDTLVLYSDGLIDAKPELLLDNPLLADRIAAANSAREMVDGLIALTDMEEPLPDDVTVLVVRCR